MADDPFNTTTIDPGINNMPDPELFAEHPGHKRKHKKSKFENKKADISINSLLDVFSVLLVFLLKSYTNSTVTIKPSRDLTVPFSISQVDAEDSTCLTVTLKDIMLDDKPIITLENGKVAERDLSHGGMMIEPLLGSLQEEVQHQRRLEARNPKSAFKGIVTVISDRYVPSTVLMQIMYTAGLSEFSKFKFLLVKTER